MTTTAFDGDRRNEEAQNDAAEDEDEVRAGQTQEACRVAGKGRASGAGEAFGGWRRRGAEGQQAQ